MRDIAKVSSTAMDVHLIVDNPDGYISAFAEAGASIITPHLEALTHPIRTLKLIRSLGKKAGIAINPVTDIAVFSKRMRSSKLVISFLNDIIIAI